MQEGNFFSIRGNACWRKVETDREQLQDREGMTRSESTGEVGTGRQIMAEKKIVSH